MKIFCPEKGHNLKVSFSAGVGRVGGGYFLRRPNGDVLLDGVAFSRLG